MLIEKHIPTLPYDALNIFIAFPPITVSQVQLLNVNLLNRRELRSRTQSGTA
jgi:hypothetical protein